MPSITRKKVLPYLEGPYEIGDVNINPGDVVFDCGANFGLFTSLASSYGCKVYSFEPTMEIISKYLNRIAQLDENIQVINKAVSDVNGTCPFFISEKSSSCNKLVGGEVKDSSRVYNVQTVTIDSFVSDEHINKVDFIKADIEGAERKMLMGAKYTLKEYAPKLAICYYHCFDDLRVLTKLIHEANPNYEITRKYKKLYAVDRRK